MKTFLLYFCAFIYCNLTWQIIVWSNDLLHSFIGLLFVFIFPIFSGVAIYLFLTLKLEEEDRGGAFIIAGLLIPILYMVSYATRMPEYVKFVHSGYSSFSGDVSGVNSNEYVFYTLKGFEIKNLKDGEFSVSYSSYKPKSSTTYYKHFVIPVFDAKNVGEPKVWLCAAYKSQTISDDYKYNLYGFDKTGLSKSIYSDIISGIAIRDYDCDRAILQYQKKFNLPKTENTLILDVKDETAEVYYEKARFHFWIFTGSMNLFFLALFGFVPSKSD